MLGLWGRYGVSRDLMLQADASSPFPAARDADRLLAELYAREYRPLTRLAVLLVLDLETADEIVGDAFAALHGLHGSRRWPRDIEQALSCLRRAVVSNSRSVRQHRRTAGGNALLERSAIVDALRGLPERQREAIVLRYYGNLSEAEVAAAMGARRGMVKSYLARGMSSLRAVLVIGVNDGSRGMTAPGE
jgi:DNA-directed RNA polymerase specialized sigma24 family protein